MNDSRTYLQKGTIVTLESGDIYEITGAPVGCGGGSVIYPDLFACHSGVSLGQRRNRYLSAVS